MVFSRSQMTDLLVRELQSKGFSTMHQGSYHGLTNGYAVIRIVPASEATLIHYELDPANTDIEHAEDHLDIAKAVFSKALDTVIRRLFGIEEKRFKVNPKAA